jgi:hypothetical protein
MGNSSLSVEQVLGSFNFAVDETIDDVPSIVYRASVGLKKFAILHHSHGGRLPTKYTDPVTVSLYETVGSLHYRTWTKRYESVSEFIAVCQKMTPWNVATCEKPGCKAKPVPDSSMCSKHMSDD